MSKMERLIKQFWDVSKPSVATRAPLTEIEQELYEERAAIMQYDAGMSRKDAEMAALQYILGYRHKP